MSFEDIIKNAFLESMNGERRGDTPGETEMIREYIKDSKKIVVPNCNDQKVEAINEVLKKFGLSLASHLNVYTNCCDASRMPAVEKACLALDITGADLVIARGRLGVPGSGSMLIIMDCRGRILSAAISPPHHAHGKTVYEAVKDEIKTALERIGFVDGIIS
ncbi:hypothetical protein J2128_001527 [Methanomicrobium sp. W14]|uniref:DUF3236 domain-containing protein n=1 Tax=Methanomicrobium sp. W14 TaxID=2817839 RepID=UPI001AE15BD9|nr:DUF3236 domain-containing protein [Methanomicrobium sp. W14]MBP2133573.1 hypothetical protein [Methanomicrobium sp. W14]